MDNNVGDVQIFQENCIWTIKNATKTLKFKKLEILKSPIFGSGSVKGLYPEYFITLVIDSQAISLSISLTKNSMPKKVNVTCRFSVINSSGNFSHTKLNDFQLGHEVDCKFDKYMEKDYLNANLDVLLLNDSLRLYCEIINKDTCIINMPLHRVPEDFEPFFESALLSDATVVAADKVFPVHKVMLSARSSVFSEMLSAATLPSKNAKIEIKDLNDNVIKEVLRFIYTGKVNNLHKMAEDLLAAASKYKIEELKTISEYSLCKTITTQNVARRLLLANNHDAAHLKNDAILYIYKNRKQVTNTDGYKLIENSYPSVLAEAFQILLSKHD